MNDALQRAIDCLQIDDVYLHASESRLAEGFEPKYQADLESLDVQFKHLVTHSSVLLVEEEGQPSVQLFRVFVELGVRWLEPADRGGVEDERVRAEIGGVLVAEYRMQEDPGKDALKAFALRNASYHVWPYWREYLTAQCMRMNLPKLMLPAVQFAQNPKAD
jgi:hypothetical protein